MQKRSAGIDIPQRTHTRSTRSVHFDFSDLDVSYSGSEFLDELRSPRGLPVNFLDAQNVTGKSAPLPTLAKKPLASPSFQKQNKSVHFEFEAESFESLRSPRALRRPVGPTFDDSKPLGKSAPALDLSKSTSDERKFEKRNQRSLQRSFSDERLYSIGISPTRGTFLITVDSAYGQMPIRCHAWNTVKDIKDALSIYLRNLIFEDVFPCTELPLCSEIESSMIRLFSAGKALRERATLLEEQIRSGSCIFATLCVGNSSVQVPHYISLYGEFINDKKESRDLVEACAQGFDCGYLPKLSSEGSGGTYFLKNANDKIVAVFKPDDEEARTPNNPRGYQGVMHQTSLRKGILSGEAGVREVAAYVLDRGFAHVPLTTRVEAIHNLFCYNVGGKVAKAGSLQEYVHFRDMACDLAPQKFDKDQVHRIGLLDIRIVNTDRNDANILVVPQPNNDDLLVPIDHGYCLPDQLEIAWCDWCWLDWPQAKLPFSKEALDYIDQINVDEDADLLRRKLSIREEAINLMKICCFVLKRGAKAGLCLYDVGKIISRDKLDCPSLLEITIQQAIALSSRLRQPSRLIRSSTMTMQCSRCNAWLSNVSGDCPCYGSNNSDSDSLESPSKEPTFTSPRAANKVKNPLSNVDDSFWQYFDNLLTQVIAVRTGRQRRRNSCVAFSFNNNNTTKSF